MDNEICEGYAKVKIPKHVFYNPVQEFNRDITIAIINHFIDIANSHPKEKFANIYKNEIKILEGLSATGLRSVRFAKEIHKNVKIVANDIDPNAVDLINENLKMNNVEEKVSVSCSDVNYLIHKSLHDNEKYHIIDLDPYGSACRFLDSAVQGLVNGGLLCVTCTDAAVLCGASSGTSMGKYGSNAFGSQLHSTHEMGVRILLQSIQTCAGRYSLYIEPLLSLSVDFYMRVFVRVWNSPGVVKTISSKSGMVYLCSGCHTYQIQKLGQIESKNNCNTKVSCASVTVNSNKCKECESNYIIAGPIWVDSIHNKSFCEGLKKYLEERKQKDKKVFQTVDRMIGMISVAIEELEDVPLFYNLDKLCKVLRIVTPSMNKVRSAILNAGYRVSSSHCCSTSIKTDIPIHLLWKIIIQSQASDSDQSYKPPNDIAKNIITNVKQYPDTPINYTIHQDAEPLSKQRGLIRFPPNPKPNWGPKPKAQKLNE